MSELFKDLKFKFKVGDLVRARARYVLPREVEAAFKTDQERDRESTFGMPSDQIGVILTRGVWEERDGDDNLYSVYRIRWPRGAVQDLYEVEIEAAE